MDRECTLTEIVQDLVVETIRAAATSYYLAPSLVALRAEVNTRWPNRDKASDGWIGDTSHSARVSDHNPDWDSDGVVRAIDIDKDGVDMNALIAAVFRDPRVAYIIWNGRIASATDDGAPWDWEPYYGSNQHTQHIHISIRHTRSAETDTSPWFTETEEEDDIMAMDKDELRRIIRSESALGVIDAMNKDGAFASYGEDVRRRLSHILLRTDHGVRMLLARDLPSASEIADAVVARAGEGQAIDKATVTAAMEEFFASRFASDES